MTDQSKASKKGPQLRFGPPRAARFNASNERWSPTRWTGELGQALVRAIDRKKGRIDSGLRPAHSHGYVMTGEFRSNPTSHEQLRKLSDFAGFGKPPEPEEPDQPSREVTSKAIVRFSNLTNRLDEPDIMGMATKIVLTTGEVTDLVAMSVDVFPVATSRDFLAYLSAQSNRVLLAPRLAALIVTRRASSRASLRTLLARKINHGNGLATTYHGVQTFRLIRTENDSINSIPMRYRWVPASGNDAGRHCELDPARPPKASFDLELLLRQPGTRLTTRELARMDDPRYPWTGMTELVLAGTLTLDKIVSTPPPSLSFNPATLAPGLGVGDDDIFNGRQSAYAVSQAARLR